MSGYVDLNAIFGVRRCPPRAMFPVLLVYGVVSLACWTVPLLSILHAESSAVIAATAFFAAGLNSVRLFAEGRSLRDVLLLQEAALLLPWALLSVTALWQPNCAYAQGLLLYLVFAAVTVCFAVSMARMLVALPFRRRGLLLILAGLGLLVVGPLYDVGFHPQFYTYNHVFGGFLGPIYDEQLELRPGLFAFRTLTLLWAVLFVLVAERMERKAPPAGVLAVAVAVLVSYSFAPELGMVTTKERIREALGSRHRSRHFDIYFDSTAVSKRDLQRIVEDHEYRYAELRRTLGVDVGRRIESYLYPTPTAKARLTGARYTNVAPVWLPTPQTHVLVDGYESVFPHELVHVFSREFGLRWVGASLSVGLVEGLAVALEPPDGRPDPREQVSAALFVSDVARNAEEPAQALARVVAERMSPLGFWTSRGAVSYTMMGSFVRFLLDAYGAERLKRVYARAQFEDVYGKPAVRLAAEWAENVLALEAVNASAAELVTLRFAVPSLFEKECPHYVPAHRRRYLEASDAALAGDSVRAYRLSERAMRLEPGYVPALDLWARLALARGEEAEVIRRGEAVDAEAWTPSLLVRLGEAHALTGDAAAARRLYDQARRRLPSFAHEAAAVIALHAAAADSRTATRAVLSGAAEPEGHRAVDHVIRAIARAHHEDYEQAVGLLRTTSAHALKAELPELGEILARRRLVWAARFAHRAGRLSEAWAYADSSAAEYRALGAFNEADVQEDFRRKMRWLMTEYDAGIARSEAASQ